MAFNNKFKNPQNFQGVVLAPVSDDMQDDINLEPPFVRQRHGNLSFCYIDSSIAAGQSNSFTVGGTKISHLFSSRIKRFCLSSLRIGYNVPNVNPYNNSLTVQMRQLSPAVSYVPFTFTIPTGYYTTVTNFITAFIIGINLARPVGTPAFTASNSLQTDPSVYDVTTGSSNYEFYYVNTSPMVKFGRFLVNLPINQVYASVQTMGSIQLIYTRYIDINSYTLSEYSKNYSTSDGLGKSSLIYRLFDTPNGVDGNGNFISFSRDRFIELGNLAWINYDRSRTISSIDIQIYDEFGNLLYIPTYTDRPTDFFINLGILTEL